MADRLDLVLELMQSLIGFVWFVSLRTPPPHEHYAHTKQESRMGRSGGGDDAAVATNPVSSEQLGINLALPCFTSQ